MKSLILNLWAKMPSLSISSVVVGIIVGYVGHPLIKLALALVVSVIKLIRFL